MRAENWVEVDGQDEVCSQGLPLVPALSAGFCSEDREYRGEGENANAQDEVHSQVRPLTPALSPEYRGEGENAFAGSPGEPIPSDQSQADAAPKKSPRQK